MLLDFSALIVVAGVDAGHGWFGFLYGISRAAVSHFFV
jgi:hypothetical protein